MKHFIIDTLRTNKEGKLTQKWEETFTSQADAEAYFDTLENDRTCIAVALTDWTPGSIGMTGILKTGDHARNLMGGVPKAHIIKWAERSFAAKYDSFVSLSDWTIHDGKMKEVTTQPSPGFKLSPKPREESEIAFMKSPKQEKPGLFNIKFKHKFQDGSFVWSAMTVPKQDLPLHEGKEGFSSAECLLTDGEKELLALMQ